jgi:hypothetical protein
MSLGAFQRISSGGSDAYVAKLNAGGSSLLYSTIWAGQITDIGRGITIDASRNAYITGLTEGENFPTTPGAYQMTYQGGTQDAYVTKLNVLVLHYYILPIWEDPIVI